MPDWVITVGTLLIGFGASYGATRAMVEDLKNRLSAIQQTANQTADRLVRLETRLDATDSLRLDERLRALEMELARSEGRYGARGTS